MILLMETSKNLVRKLNKKRILQQVFNHGSISRSQISKNLNLNKVTVSEIVTELLDQQFFYEFGKGSSSSRGGRKPTILQLNIQYGYVLSFDLGYDYIDGVLTLINGQSIGFKHRHFQNLDITKRLEIIREQAEELSRTVDTLAGLMGISVAIHGVVKDNKVLYTPYIDFEEKDIASILEQQFHVPVLLQNEANLSVIYERDFQSHESIDNLVCISIHKGIGAGIILNNRLYTGIRGEAGEIGHSVIYEAGINREEMRHPIEEYCSEDAIIEKIQAATGKNQLTSTDIRNFYESKNTKVLQIMNDFCFYMASIIHNMIITLDPAQVIINSNLIADFPELLDKIRNEIPYLTNEKTQVILSENSKHAILLGGASMIINKVLEMEPGDLFFGTISENSEVDL